MRLLNIFLTMLATSVSAADAPLVGVDEYDVAARLRRVESFPERAREMPPVKAAIAVDPQRTIGELNPLFFGYNLEDLSHEIFPGLYAQMLYGESFEDEPDVDLPAGWVAHLEPQNEDTPRDPAGLQKWRGAWALEDGVLTVTGSRQRRIWTDQVRLAEGTIECEVSQPATERSHWGPGLLVGWQQAGYYYVYLAPERNVVVLAKGTDQRFVQGSRELASKHLPLAYDRWYRLEVTRRRARITVAVDGQQVLDFTDPEPLGAGGVGLDSSFSVSRFRHLAVTPLGEPTWKADFTLADRPYTHTANISRWWDPVVTGTATARYGWEKHNPYNTDRCQLVQMTGGAGTVGVVNTGLHNVGLSVREGWRYQGRLYLRGHTAGDVTLALQSRDGTRTYATQSLQGIATDWKRFDIALTAARTDPAARFALWIDQPGQLVVDQVVLMPGEQGLFHGLPVRKDLAEKLVAGIGHIRFGGDMINSLMFDWRTMRLPPDQRRQYLDGWNYHKSAQFMIFEFLDFCRAAGIEPVANLGEHLPAEEVAAFVEYCNGDAATAGGRQRIADGHAAPYGLRRIMYGNGLPPIEQAERLPDLLAKVDPQVRLILGDIGHTPWSMISRRDPPHAARLNRFLDRLEAVSSRPEVALLGSHRLWNKTLDEAQAGFPALGKTARLYAAEINGSAYNWQRGLCDALIAVTSQRRGGLVWGHAYCNALQAHGHLYEWNQGHIHFTPSASWYQPSGWVVRMLGEHMLPVAIEADATCPRLSVEHAGEHDKKAIVEVPALTVSASRSRDGRCLTLNVVNLWGGPVETTVTLGDATSSWRVAGTTIGSLHLAGRNTADRPDYVVPKAIAVPSPVAGQFTTTLAPMSLTIVSAKLVDRSD
jgi:alpha-L-arabinofuranosidase